MHSDLSAVRDALAGGDVEFALLEVRGDRAKVVAALHPESLFGALGARFDEAWSLGYEVTGTAVRCRLSLLGQHRDGLGFGADVHQARLVALTDAARAWGIVPDVVSAEAAWVEYDSEEGPNTDELTSSAPPRTVSAPGPSEPPKDPQMEKAKKHIDDLMDQLRDRGLGKQASVVIARHGGYGKDLDDSRRIYAELKALLKS